MQCTDLLIRFSAQSDCSHKLRDSHDRSSTFNQVMWIVSRNHTNPATIPFAFLGKEIFIEDRSHFFHDFLIFCSSFLFRAFKHTSYKPNVEMSVLHDIHELNMFEKISFLLQIYYSLIISEWQKRSLEQGLESGRLPLVIPQKSLSERKVRN